MNLSFWDPSLPKIQAVSKKREPERALEIPIETLRQAVSTLNSVVESFEHITNFWRPADKRHKKTKRPDFRVYWFDSIEIGSRFEVLEIATPNW